INITMKINLGIIGFLLLTSCVKGPDLPQDTLIDLDKDAVAKEILLYVSHAKQGDGSGSSPQNAADFLNTSFWDKTGQILTNSPVRVLFAKGDYSRAYTEKALVLNNIGNYKNRLTLEGIDGQTIFTVPENLPEKSVLIDIRNTQNLHFKNF